MAMAELQLEEAAPAVDSLYIGGEWRSATSGRSFPVTDPSSGAVLASVADGSSAEAREAVAAAEASSTRRTGSCSNGPRTWPSS
jgi:hypothetical protein